MDNNEPISEAVWSTAYVNDLPDSHFLYVAPGGEKDADGKTKPRSLRKFPYKDKSGKADLPHLRNALARIPQSNLSPEVKKRVTSKARTIAKNAGIDVSESFLDDIEMRFPLFDPFINQTIFDYNDGVYTEHYEAEEYALMGEQLAKHLSVWYTAGNTSHEYDDDGRVISSDVETDSQYNDTWIYQDGIVVRNKRIDKSRSSELTEYSDGEVNDVVNESAHSGEVVKKLRSKRRMSRGDAAAKMNVSAARLAEIEGGDEMSDTEKTEIASAFGVSLQFMNRMLGAEEIVPIIDEVVPIIEETKQEQELLVTIEETVERSVDGNPRPTKKITGSFIAEEITKTDDGTIQFRVPLFKIGELTSNGNRYTRACAENIVNDLQALQKGYSLRENGTAVKRSVLDIEFDGMPLNMLATHRGRKGEGNPILETAGRVVSAEIRALENSDWCWIHGETIPTTAGRDVAAQILLKPPMIRGVSLFGVPTVFEANEASGHDVDRLHLVGSDFTNWGGNLIQFKDANNAKITVLA